MGIDVTVSVNCSGCSTSIDEDDEVYCEHCAAGVARSVETGHCSQCRQRFDLATMISKVAGLMCFKCCKKYEEDLMTQKAEA